MLISKNCVAWCLILIAGTRIALGQEVAGKKWCAAAVYQAEDSLDAKPDKNEDSQQCLAGLTNWIPGEFTVQVHAAEKSAEFQRISFPSPKPSGIPECDLVSCEWYPARGADGEVLHARAVVVVHESGRAMAVGKLISSELARRGCHAFLVELPGYGYRKFDTAASNAPSFVAGFQQGVADVRRARDAITALPQVDVGRIVLQGTSLGGFVASLTGALDQGFDRTVLLLSGGNLYGVLTQGAEDAKKTLERIRA